MRKSPLSADELASVLRPLREAELLPPAAYLDPRVLELERSRIFARSWLMVGRTDELETPGAWKLVPIGSEGVILVRGPDLRLRAFFNVCRHRGALLVREPAGESQSFVCRYHGFTYDLAGALRKAPHCRDLVGFSESDHALVPVRVEEWKGFVFVATDDQAPPLESAFAPIPTELDRVHVSSLRLGRRVEGEAPANWKLLIENFQESHHFPGVHPALHAHTPFERSTSFVGDGPWLGGTMDLVDGAETVSTDGKLHGRPFLGGLAETDRRRVRDYFLWPNLLLSVQPDYLLTYSIWPLAVDRTRIVADIYFHPAAFVDGFSPADVYDFWDLTNREDREICAEQQIGIASRGYRRGRYVAVEDGVHAFDRLVARAYLEGLDG